MPPLDCCLTSWLSDGVLGRIEGAHNCGMVAAPQNLIDGDFRSFSLPSCSEFSVSLVACVCDGGVFALDQSGGHQGSRVPLTVQGHCRQTHQQTCAGVAWQGLHCVCEQKSVGEEGCSG